jgi:hypothetical protein
MLSYGAVPHYSPCFFLLPIPLANSLLPLNPSYLLRIPPLVWCDPVHLGPRLLVNWPHPPHSFPIPISWPPGVSPNQLCALLRRHHNPSFTWSGTCMVDFPLVSVPCMYSFFPGLSLPAVWNCHERGTAVAIGVPRISSSSMGETTNLSRSSDSLLELSKVKGMG